MFPTARQNHGCYFLAFDINLGLKMFVCWALHFHPPGIYVIYLTMLLIEILLPNQVAEVLKYENNTQHKRFKCHFVHFHLNGENGCIW